jgi:hypothetical protein
MQTKTSQPCASCAQPAMTACLAGSRRDGPVNQGNRLAWTRWAPCNPALENNQLNNQTQPTNQPHQPMKTTLTTSQIVNALGADKNANWSYQGASALAEYLEEIEGDTGEELELDVVAIRCDYSEHPSLHAWADDYFADWRERACLAGRHGRRRKKKRRPFANTSANMAISSNLKEGSSFPIFDLKNHEPDPFHPHRQAGIRRGHRRVGITSDAFPCRLARVAGDGLPHPGLCCHRRDCNRDLTRSLCCRIGKWMESVRSCNSQHLARMQE